HSLSHLTVGCGEDAQLSFEPRYPPVGGGDVNPRPADPHDVGEHGTPRNHLVTSALRAVESLARSLSRLLRRAQFTEQVLELFCIVRAEHPPASIINAIPVVLLIAPTRALHKTGDRHTAIDAVELVGVGNTDVVELVAQATVQVRSERPVCDSNT